jgi:hypothetical protein
MIAARLWCAGERRWRGGSGNPLLERGLKDSLKYRVLAVR